MSMILDGSNGLTTPGVVNTAGETIATTLAVTGATNLAVSSGNVGIGTASPTSKLHIRPGTDSNLEVQVSTVTTGVQLLSINSARNAYGPIELSGSQNVFYTNGTERMRIDSSGNLLVGTTSATLSQKVSIAGSTVTYNLLCIQNTGTTYGSNQYLALFANSTGGIAGTIQHTAVTTVAYATTSDNRLKENIVDADTVLDKISAVKVRAFDWKEDKLHSEYGFIAQELYKVFPDAVGKGDDAEDLTNPKGTWQVEYGRLTPMLLKAIQELKAIVDAQAVRIAALEP